MPDAAPPAPPIAPSEVVQCVSYGLGGDWIDRSASGGYGEDYLLARLRKLPNLNPLNSVYAWSDLQRRFDDVRAAKRKNPACKVSLAGDSLGDNELGDDLANLESAGIEVDLICGFQGSEWGKHTVITPNCRRALIVYNPVWMETGGLGAYALPLQEPPEVPAGRSLYDGRWYVGNGGRTHVRYVQIEAPHPDDWGVAQDLAFNLISQLSRGLI